MDMVDEHVETEEIMYSIGFDWMLDNFINSQANPDNKKTIRCFKNLQLFLQLNGAKKLCAENVSKMKDQLSHSPKVHQRIFLTSVLSALIYKEWDAYLEKIPILQRVYTSTTVDSSSLSWVQSVWFCITLAMDENNKDKAIDILQQHKKYLSKEDEEMFNELISKFEMFRRSVHNYPSCDIRAYIRNVQITVMELNQQIEAPSHLSIVEKFKSSENVTQHSFLSDGVKEQPKEEKSSKTQESSKTQTVLDDDANNSPAKLSDHEKNAIDSTCTIEESVPDAPVSSDTEPKATASEKMATSPSLSSAGTVNNDSTKRKQYNISGKVILTKLKQHIMNLKKAPSTCPNSSEESEKNDVFESQHSDSDSIQLPSTSGSKRGIAINKERLAATKEWISTDRGFRRENKRKFNISRNFDTATSLSSSEFENRLQNEQSAISIHTEQNTDASEEISSQEVKHKKKQKTQKKFRIKLQHNTPSVYSRTSTPNKSAKKRSKVEGKSSSFSSSSSDDENLGDTKHNRLKVIHKYLKTPVHKDMLTSAVLNQRCRAERQKELRNRRGFSSHTKHPWRDHEVNLLIRGVNKYGVGRWSKILVYGKDVFKNRTAVMLKDKYRWLLNKDLI